LEGANPDELPVKVMDQPSELSSYTDINLIEQFGLSLPDYLK
jgi:hypothetical protein